MLKQLLVLLLVLGLAAVPAAADSVIGTTTETVGKAGHNGGGSNAYITGNDGTYNYGGYFGGGSETSYGGGMTYTTGGFLGISDGIYNGRGVTAAFRRHQRNRRMSGSTCALA